MQTARRSRDLVCLHDGIVACRIVEKEGLHDSRSDDTSNFYILR